jgi:hypothetical protein
MQFRGEFYHVFNNQNQYINTLNLDVSSMSAGSPFVQTEKGGPTGVAGTLKTSGGRSSSDGDSRSS